MNCSVSADLPTPPLPTMITLCSAGPTAVFFDILYDCLFPIIHTVNELSPPAKRKRETPFIRTPNTCFVCGGAQFTSTTSFGLNLLKRGQRETTKENHGRKNRVGLGRVVSEAIQIGAMYSTHRECSTFGCKYYASDCAISHFVYVENERNSRDESNRGGRRAIKHTDTLSPSTVDVPLILSERAQWVSL